MKIQPEQNLPLLFVGFHEEDLELRKSRMGERLFNFAVRNRVDSISVKRDGPGSGFVYVIDNVNRRIVYTEKRNTSKSIIADFYKETVDTLLDYFPGYIEVLARWPFRVYNQEERDAFVMQYPEARFDDNGRIIYLQHLAELSLEELQDPHAKSLWEEINVFQELYVSNLSSRYKYWASFSSDIRDTTYASFQFDSLYRLVLRKGSDRTRADSTVYDYGEKGLVHCRAWSMDLSSRHPQYRLWFSRDITYTEGGGRVVADHKETYRGFYPKDHRYSGKYDLSTTFYYTYDAQNRLIEKREKYLGRKITYNDLGKIESVSEYYIPDIGRDQLLCVNEFEYCDSLLMRVVCRFPEERPSLVHYDRKDEHTGKLISESQFIYEVVAFEMEYDENRFLTKITQRSKKFFEDTTLEGWNGLIAMTWKIDNFEFRYDKHGVLQVDGVKVYYRPEKE